MFNARNIDQSRELCDICLEFSFRVTGKRSNPITEEAITYLNDSSSRVS